MAKLIKCSDCNKKVSVNASTCPNCGAPVVLPKEKPKPKKWVSFLIGAVVLLLILAMCSSDPDETEVTTASSAEVVNNEPTPEPLVTETEVIEENSGMTTQQKNAVRSAKRYISFKGFSRDGLIQQLSSSAGDGYKLEDATIAVDSLDIDYNEQAVRSAENYLSFKGFSCDGLIQQLSSSAGDKFTVSQAEYGAKASGACD